MLAPSEDLRPMAQVIAYDRQAISPGFDNGFHVVMRVLESM
jgi:hypothetical protein